MEEVQDPIKRKNLHSWLVSQNMTDLSYETFSTEYGKNDSKYDNLYKYVKSKEMTDLDYNTFKAEYFGDVKKKENSDFVGPQQETPAPTQEPQQNLESPTQEPQQNGSLGGADTSQSNLKSREKDLSFVQKAEERDANLQIDQEPPSIDLKQDPQNVPLDNASGGRSNFADFGYVEPSKDISEKTLVKNIDNGNLTTDAKKLILDANRYKKDFLLGKDYKSPPSDGLVRADEAQQKYNAQETENWKNQRIENEKLYTEHVGKILEENGGRLEFLTSNELLSLGIDPALAETSVVKVNGKNTSMFDLNQKLVDSDFQKQMKEGKVKIEFNEDSKLAKDKDGRFKDYLDTTKELFENQSKADSMSGVEWAARNVANAVVGIPSSLFRAADSTIQEFFNEELDPVVTELFKIASPEYRTLKNTLTAFESASAYLEEGQRVYGKDIVESIEAGNYKDAAAQMTKTTVDLVPIIALAMLAPEAAPGVFGVGAYGDKLSTIQSEKREAKLALEGGEFLSEKQKRASQYNHWNTLGNAGVYGLMNYYLFGGYIKGISSIKAASKYSKMNLSELEIAYKSSFKKELSKFTGEAIGQQKFFAKMNAGTYLIDKITEVNTDISWNSYRNDVAKGIGLTVPFYGLHVLNHRSQIKKAITGLAKHTVGYSRGNIEVNWKRDMTIKRLSEEYDYLISTGEMTDRTADIYEKKIVKLQDKALKENNKNLEGVDKLTDKDILNFAKKYEDIIATKKAVEEVGAESEVGKVLIQDLKEQQSKYSEKLEMAIENATKSKEGDLKEDRLRDSQIPVSRQRFTVENNNGDTIIVDVTTQLDGSRVIEQKRENGGFSASEKVSKDNTLTNRQYTTGAYGDIKSTEDVDINTVRNPRLVEKMSDRQIEAANIPVAETTKKLEEATGVTSKKVSEISTDESRFQGRKRLNEDVVEKKPPIEKDTRTKEDLDKDIKQEKIYREDIDSQFEQGGDNTYSFRNQGHTKGLKVIIPSSTQGNLRMSKEEQSAVNAVGGLTMLYTKDNQGEPGVGKETNFVKIQKDKVYVIQSDKEGFYDEALKRFKKQFPNQGFSANYQMAFITQVAIEQGYVATVSKWGGKGEWRAQTTAHLVPESQKPVQKSKAVKVDNAPKGPFLNVGLLVGKTKKLMSEKDVVDKLPEGVVVVSSEVIPENKKIQQEPTASLELSRELTDAEMKEFLFKTKQLSIPQMINGEGTMYGAKDWGGFNADYFFIPKKGKLSELKNQDPTQEVKAKEKADKNTSEIFKDTTMEVAPEEVKPKEKRTDLAKDLKLEEADKVLAKLEKELKDFGKDTLGMNIPVVVMTGAVKAMRVAVKTAKTTADVLSTAIDYLKNTDWYKGLTSKQQKKAENAIIDELNKVLSGKNKEVKKDKRTKINKKIDKMLSEENPKSEQEIIDSFEGGLNKMIAKDILESKKTLTPKDALKELDRISDESEKAMKKKNIREGSFFRQKMEDFSEFFHDRKYRVKENIKSAGGLNVRNWIIVQEGASGYAKHISEKAYNKIYRGYNSESRTILDQILFAKKVIDIARTRSEKGLEPITNTNNFNVQRAEAALTELKSKLGEEKFNEMEEKANTYFGVFRGALFDMYRSRIISKEMYEDWAHNNYMPTQFLYFMKELDQVDQGKAEVLKNKGIKGRKYGLDSEQMMDSEAILTKVLSIRSRANAFNTSAWKLKEFIEERKVYIDELRKKQNPSKTDLSDIEKFDRLNKGSIKYPKDIRDKTEKEKKDWFSSLSKDKQREVTILPKVIFNPIIGMKESGKPIHKKAPAGFTKLSFFLDGVENQMLMENEWYKRYMGTIRSVYSDPSVREKVAILTGTKLLKSMATGNNPMFLLTNTPRDFAFITTFSEEYSNNILKNWAMLSKDAAHAVKSMIADDLETAGLQSEWINKNRDTYELAMKYGIQMDMLYQQGSTIKLGGWKEFKRTATKTIAGKNAPNVKFWSDMILNTVTAKKLQRYSEMGLRLAVFHRANKNVWEKSSVKNAQEFLEKYEGIYKKEGLSEDAAQIKAQEQLDNVYTNSAAAARNTTDFNQGGYGIKDIDAVVPYLNASVQGTRVAVEAFKKDPVNTASRMLQTAVLTASISSAASVTAISAFRNKEEESDEEKRMSSLEIYLKAIRNVSKWDLMNYNVFFTGKKDEEGNFNYVKVAKPQMITPLSSAIEGIRNRLVSESYGIKYEDKTSSLVANSFLKNVVPSANITTAPIVKAGFALFMGYDVWREDYISSRHGVDTPAAEGFENPNIEDFYKEYGLIYGISPARMKGAVEAMITSPRTNPFVSVLYGGIDLIPKDTSKEAVNNLKYVLNGKNSFTETLKNPFNRVFGVTNERNSMPNLTKELEFFKTAEDIQNTITKAGIKSIVDKYEVDKDGDAAMKKIMEVKKGDPSMDEESLKRKVKSLLDNKRKNRSPIMWELVFMSDEQTATALVYLFGDALLSKQRADKTISGINDDYQDLYKEVLRSWWGTKDQKGSGEIINPKTFNEYKKQIEKQIEDSRK